MSCSPELQPQHPGLPRDEMASKRLNACAKGLPRPRHGIKNGNRLRTRSITVRRMQSMAQRSYIMQETAPRHRWRDFLAVTDYAPASGLHVPPKSKPLSVLAAIPAFNEGPTIGSVVLRAKQFAEEVVVIDDGSKDDTAEIAALAGAHVIQHARNLGKGTAIRTAWLFARERHPEALVLLDGDHQHDPKDIPRIVEPILAGKADVVLGVRWGKTSGMPLYRRIGKRALDYATAAATKNGMLTDSQCGFRVFSSRALTLIEPTDNGLSIESQMLLEAQERNLRIQEVNIDARYDIEGSTLSPGRHGSSVLGRIVTLVSEKRPLFFFGVSGAVLLLIAAGFGGVPLPPYYSTRAFAT